MNSLGERIREIRIKKNLTQKTLAQRTGISLKMLHNYEIGRNEPGASALSWLAIALNVSSDWLLGILPQNDDTFR